MKMKRHELLTKAYNGEIKKGDTFKSELGAVAIFDGNKFVFAGEKERTVGMVASHVNWEKVVKTVTVELTQEQINAIYALANNGKDDIIEHGNDRGYETVGTWNLFRKFENLYKRVGGTN